MIKAILFDFNGVIIDDERVQMKAYQEIMKEDGIDLTEDDYFACMGMDDVTFIRANFERAGKSVSAERLAAINAAKTARWRELIAKEIPLVPGADHFIRLASEDFALGIVSMAKLEEINFVLDRTGLSKFFAVIVSSEEISNHKPDPECYLKGFNQIDSYRIKQGHLPMVHGETLVVEDATQGIDAGRAAGMKTLGITTVKSADDLRRAGADAVSPDLRDWMPESVRRVFGLRAA
jgi:HAD superfamily hydrolase (TIGR01509 family)